MIRMLNLAKLQEKNFGFSFNCPRCDDKRSKGSFYWGSNNEDYIMRCWKGCQNISLGTYLKSEDSELFKEYIKLKLNNSFDGLSFSRSVKEHKVKRRVVYMRSLEQPKNAVPVDELYENHKAYLYLLNRNIPKRMMKKIYFTHNFSELASAYGYDTRKWRSEPRIIIPFWNEQREITHIQGRSLESHTNLRYMTLTVKEGLKIWGLERMRRKLPVYVVEGPLDAMFLKNSIAMGGSTILNQDLDDILQMDKHKVIFVYDNEYNETIFDVMQKKIEYGYSIVIWPEGLKGKDINAMVLNGSWKSLNISKCTYNGAGAIIKLQEWRKSWKKM